MTHICIIVKIEGKQKNAKIKPKNRKLNKNRGKFSKFGENRREIYNFLGNRREYAICIGDLGGWTPLLVMGEERR